MSAELKYTDRDVRENDNLADRAIEFVENYTGDFEFLVDCKMRLAHGGELTVGMVRGVLNCMRANPRVKDMPAPLPRDEGTVTPIDKNLSFRGTRTLRGHSTCRDTEPHESHPVPKGEHEWSGHCPGVYLINRPYSIRTKAMVKVEFVAAVSPTSMLHKTMTGWNHYIEWVTVQHGVGFYQEDLHVVPLCEKPRNVKNPILMNEAQMIDMQMNEETARLRCPRCFR